MARREEEVRRIMTADDIIKLTERLLLSLCEMERLRNVASFALTDVYEQMNFHGYNLELAMPVILDDNIVPQQLALVNGWLFRRTFSLTTIDQIQVQKK